MADDPLVTARKRAEQAVEDMAEGPLKIAAFETILANLLTESDPREQVQRVPAKVSAGRSEQPGTLTGRILAIKSEGFFRHNGPSVKCGRAWAPAVGTIR